MPLWFYNLAVYCAQLALLIATGALMVAATRLREPRLRLIYWQVLLAMGVLLPVIEPWQTAPKIEQVVVETGGSAIHAGSAGIEAAAALPVHAASSFTIYEIVAILLVSGFLLRLFWLAAGLVRLRRSRLHASPLGQHAAVEQFKTALGISPAVLISDRNSSPVTFGWRTPRILLPRKFIEMDEVRQRVILCHEFLHVRRRDWVWHVAEEILRSLFWFHLAVAWLIAQIRLCREQLVDREVVILTGSRRDYLDALFEIASSSRTSRYAPALLFLSERHLKRRVTLILKEVTMSRKKLVLALTASLGGLFLTGAIAVTLLPLRTTAAQTPSSVTPKTPTVGSDTHFYGNPNAKVTVVEFGDFQCPACRKAESVAEQVRKNLGGQVRFAYRQFPLTRIHHDAEKAAEAAECAAEQGKFWQAVGYLSDHPLDFTAGGIQEFATTLGLDQSRTMQCLSSGEMAARVQQDIQDGQALGVHSVPTLFIGNAKLVGMPSYSRLHALIEGQLHTEGAAQTSMPSGSALLSAASLAPTFAEGLNGQETSSVPQRSDSAIDPPAKGQQTGSASSHTTGSANLNQGEIQHQIDEAMKQAKVAQEAASKIDQKKLQEQIDQAMMQLKMAEVHTPKIDEAKIKQEIEQAMKQAQTAQGAVPKIDQKKLQEQIEQSMKQFEKMNTPEMRQKMHEQMRQLEKMNTPEMRKHMQEQMEQLKKMNTPEMRQQLKQAMEQAMMVQESVSKMNKDEVQRQLEQARKEVEQAKKEAQAARKEAEKARQDAMEARREAEEQRKAAKPAPSAVPKPAPAPPKEAAPAPPAPPAPPAKPKTPESAGIGGGVPGGVVGGVPGGKIGGIQGGQITGVPGGITGGVITAPDPPVPPSPPPKEAVAPPAPASPTPPPPQN
ncbi:MAG TPA: thioredoxin domain-containing protein [Terriglobia bacterium]|nr:thioredoxin domain-containing protein [Terriglobia bacterium]